MLTGLPASRNHLALLLGGIGTSCRPIGAALPIKTTLPAARMRARPTDTASFCNTQPQTALVLRRADQPDHRTGRALLPRRQGPDEAERGFRAARAGRARAARHGDQAGDLQPRHGQPQHGRPRLHQHADAPQGDGARDQGCRRDAGTRSVRDRAPAAGQALSRERAGEGPGHVPDLPRHLLGPAGHPRGDDLHAQPFAARTAPGSRSASRSGSSRWWRRRCCSAAIPASGMEDNIYLEKGKLAPSNAALVEKAGRIIQILGDEIATPADARQMLGIGANARANTIMSGAPRRGDTRLSTTAFAIRHARREAGHPATSSYCAARYSYTCRRSAACARPARRSPCA